MKPYLNPAIIVPNFLPSQLMAGGLPVVFFGGMAAMYLRLYCAWRTALKFSRLGPGVKPRSIHTFWDDFDVEVAARIGRIFDAEGNNMDPAALDIAENVLKAGVAMYPNSPYLRIVYSNFLIEVRAHDSRLRQGFMAAQSSMHRLANVLHSCAFAVNLPGTGMDTCLHLAFFPFAAAGCAVCVCARVCMCVRVCVIHSQSQFITCHQQVRKNNSSGWAQLEMARKLEPNLSYQFSIFTREQEHKQQAAAGSSGQEVRRLRYMYLVTHVHCLIEGSWPLSAC